MCRFVAYLGQTVTLERVVSAPAHSLVVQSYRPVEMTSGVVNADGFGVGWYNRALDLTPCVYTNTSPIWGDRNLAALSRHVASDCIFANVRSATADVAVDQSNCQPFAYRQLLFMHNGYIERFRVTLMRKLREVLRDEYYTAIGGLTDSEHIFALLLNRLHGRPVTLPTLMDAVGATISQLRQWADRSGLRLALNCAVTNGEYMVVSRFSTVAPAPSLYYTVTSPFFSDAAVVASERLYTGPDWIAVPAGSVMGIDRDLKPSIFSLP